MRTTWVLSAGLLGLLTGCITQQPSAQREAPEPDMALALDGAVDPVVDAMIPDAQVPDAQLPDAMVPDAEVPRAPAGAACAADDDCEIGSCLADPTFPDGYCAEQDCGADVACVGGTVCVTRPGGSLCAAACDEDTCRPGYGCVEEHGTPVCLPHWAIEGRLDGMPCGSDAQCAGGTCITEWPGGFCTTEGCSDRTDCARGPDDAVDNRCWTGSRPQICVRMCQQGSDCREGYVCEPVGRDQGICYPDPSQPLLTPEAIADSPLGIECFEPGPNGDFDWGFEVRDDTTAYMVVPFSEDGARIEPIGIEGPAAPVDLQGRNGFQSVPAMLFGNLNPTVVPATRQHQDQLSAGPHSYTVISDASRMCWYHLEEATPGTEIDLNIYLVDVGITAASAPRDANLNTLLDQFESVYAGAGITIGEVRYFDVEGEAAQRYSVIRAEADVGGVLALTEPPGATKDAVLSLNVVFIQTFALPNAGGVLGISPGLPGPAGLHGTPNSGVVFTSEFLGQRFQERSGQLVDGNVYTGNVLAHEMGHYLGLFHTTETDQRSTDPLPDTVDCRGVRDFPFGCPDENNLMFPLAGADNSQVTDDQAAVILANPLTKD